ncbi:hypothetical protein [Sorangium atrum]|uniref:Uncharacterized protein n=1 Tax=Sorangium atrum TaxID=2995308 RepID=A0ABT5BRC2_9BACT|nr:hypothetical protein [Sorangium aterium]MDC0676710.1 hypothetical protein [Sorangium aterium]
MAWFYVVHGSIRFPTADGPPAWHDAPIPTWKGKGKLEVGKALEWTAREALVDPSAPAGERAAYFFDAVADGSVVTFRGFIHRDDADTVMAVLGVAAELEAKGEVLLHHVFDRDSGVRVTVAKGRMTVREGDVKMPSHVIEEVEQESMSRARRLEAGEKPPPAKAKAATKKTPKANAATKATKAATKATKAVKAATKAVKAATKATKAATKTKDNRS